MFIAKRLIAAAFLLAAAPLAARASDPVEFSLDNGMQVVVIEDHRAPVVVHMVWYRVGAADDPAGHSGIAHFLEHLMFKATDTMEEGDFDRIVQANGGRLWHEGRRPHGARFLFTVDVAGARKGAA